MSMNTALTALANAVRSKTGVSGKLSISDMTSAISGINLTPQKEFLFRVCDYDGTVLYETRANDGESVTLPSAPSHTGLVFDGWACPETISSGKVRINGRDCTAGACYHTESGKTELFVTLTAGTGLTVSFPQISSLTGIDWGDGTTGTQLSHTYSLPGSYVIKLTGMTSVPSGFIGNASASPDFSLTEARFSASVTAVSSNAFSYCAALSAVVLGSNTKNLGTSAFRYCRSLSCVVLPPSVTTLSAYAFGECIKLKDAVLTGNVASIPTQCFTGCRSLTRLTVGNGTGTVSGGFISNAVNIRSVSLPETVSAVADDAFSSSPQLEKIRLPASLGTLGKSAFSGCGALISLDIPSGITVIPQKLCENCCLLSEVTIPAGITTISNNAFSKCYSLSFAVIPASVTSIGAYAFSECVSLGYLDFSEHTAVPELTATALNGISENCRILVPEELYETWRTAENWSAYSASIEPVSRIPDPLAVLSPSSDSEYNYSAGYTESSLSFGSSAGYPDIYISNGTETVLIENGEPVSLSGVSGALFFYTDEYDNGEYVMYTYYNMGGSLTFTAAGTYEIYGEITVDGHTIRTGKSIFIIS